MGQPAFIETPARLPGRCDLDRASFAIAISRIDSDGCTIEAACDCDWDCACDFLHLSIADRIEVNGRVLVADGRRAEIRFFGQLHPVVVKELAAV